MFEEDQKYRAAGGVWSHAALGVHKSVEAKMVEQLLRVPDPHTRMLALRETMAPQFRGAERADAIGRAVDLARSHVRKLGPDREGAKRASAAGLKQIQKELDGTRTRKSRASTSRRRTLAQTEREHLENRFAFYKATDIVFKRPASPDWSDYQRRAGQSAAERPLTPPGFGHLLRTAVNFDGCEPLYQQLHLPPTG